MNTHCSDCDGWEAAQRKHRCCLPLPVTYEDCHWINTEWLLSNKTGSVFMLCLLLLNPWLCLYLSFNILSSDSAQNSDFIFIMTALTVLHYNILSQFFTLWFLHLLINSSNWLSPYISSGSYLPSLWNASLRKPNNPTTEGSSLDFRHISLTLASLYKCIEYARADWTPSNILWRAWQVNNLSINKSFSVLTIIVFYKLMSIHFLWFFSREKENSSFFMTCYVYCRESLV